MWGLDTISCTMVRSGGLANRFIIVNVHRLCVDMYHGAEVVAVWGLKAATMAEMEAFIRNLYAR